MANIGTTFTKFGKKALLCGSGELGKEVAIELQRYGVEVVAVDKYENAPAMQVANSFHVISMLDGMALREIIEQENPDIIIPEVEAIATDVLVELEKEGYHVIPTAKAAFLTMNREGIRRLAAETLGLPTSPYRFASDRAEFEKAVSEIGIPCVVKPVMSSSGHGQSVIKSEADIDSAWHISQEGGRAGGGKVIVEGFVDFDYEITLLTVRHCAGTTFLEPIGHHQVDGDYRESWQPQPMPQAAVGKFIDSSRRNADFHPPPFGKEGVGRIGLHLGSRGTQRGAARTPLGSNYPLAESQAERVEAHELPLPIDKGNEADLQDPLVAGAGQGGTGHRLGRKRRSPLLQRGGELDDLVFRIVDRDGVLFPIVAAAKVEIGAVLRKRTLPLSESACESNAQRCGIGLPAQGDEITGPEADNRQQKESEKTEAQFIHNPSIDSFLANMEVE